MNLHLLNLKEAASLLNNHPIITIFFSLFVCNLVAKTCFFPKPNRKLPPSPPNKLPFLGHLHLLGNYPHRSLHALSRRHGPLMLLHLGISPTLIVSSAAAVREIMKTHDLIFSNRPGTSTTRRLFYDNKDLALSPYGEYWRQMRSITVLQLLSSKRVRSFQAIKEDEMSLMIKKITQETDPSCSCGINMSDMFALFTNNVICRVAFGRRYSDEEQGRKFKELLDEFMMLLGGFDVGDFIPWLSWLRYVTGLHQQVERVFTELDRFLDMVIDDHVAPKTSENDTDFVDVLLNIQNDGSRGFPLHRDKIKAILLDAFSGGTDTTFTALEWAMTEMLKEAQKEIRDIVGADQAITEADIEKLQYFKAVVKETLRMHPPVTLLPREPSKDVNTEGLDIAAGTRVLINAWAIGRDPETWTEPDEFRPERFLESDISFKGQDFGLIPFGDGRRGCPGITLAITTIEYALEHTHRCGAGYRSRGFEDARCGYRSVWSAEMANPRTRSPLAPDLLEPAHPISASSSGSACVLSRADAWTSNGKKKSDLTV